MSDDRDDEIDGRFIDAVAEYATTCDYCQELETKPFEFVDDETQLAACWLCVRDHGIEKIRAHFIRIANNQ